MEAAGAFLASSALVASTGLAGSASFLVSFFLSSAGLASGFGSTLETESYSGTLALGAFILSRGVGAGFLASFAGAGSASFFFSAGLSSFLVSAAFGSDFF